VFYFTSKLLVNWKSLEGSDLQVAFESEKRKTHAVLLFSSVAAAADEEEEEDDECARAREEKSPSHRFRPVFLKQRIMKKL